MTTHIHTSGPHNNASANTLTLYGETFNSRLLLGTSRYP